MHKLLTKKLAGKKGFTLAELLIVIAIIAVLIAIAIPVFTSALAKARISTEQANARSVHGEATSYYLLNEAFDEDNEPTGYSYEPGATDADPGTATFTAVYNKVLYTWTYVDDAKTATVTLVADPNSTGGKVYSKPASYTYDVVGGVNP